MIKKCYIAIFVCYVTKAVHIEVVKSLTTKAFLAALQWFIAHQGKRRTLYSDNGTKFQGAANELHDIYKMLQSHPKCQEYRTSWPLKDAPEISFHHMDLTSADSGKQQ